MGFKKAIAWYNDLKAARPCGWSEGMTYATEGANLDTVLAAWETLCTLREQMLGIGIQRMATRVSDVEVIGDSVVGGPVPLPTNGMYNTTLYNNIKALGIDPLADFGWTALNIRLEMSTLNRRVYNLHGNPDVLTIDSQKTIVDLTWQAAFNAWKAVVIGGLWGGYVINKPFAFHTITNYDSATGQFTIPDLAAVIGDLVYFRRVTGLNMPKGYYRIVLAAPPIYKLGAFVNTGTVWTGQGQAAKKTYVFRPFTNAKQIGETERKVGRPFGTCIGRRARPGLVTV